MNTLQNFVAHPGFTFMRGVSRFRTARSAFAGAQRLARFNRYRKFIAQVDARGSLFKAVDVDATVEGLDRDGFALGVDLPPEVLQALLAFSSGATFYADRNPACGFKPWDLTRARAVLGRDFVLAQCFNVAAQCGVVKRLESDPKLLLIAAKYLGTAPTHVGTNLWWSYAVRAGDVARNKAAQLFHYDLDDYAFMKFFFYLTDVDTRSGPHVIVRGSHTHKRFNSIKDRFLVRRYSDAEVGSSYGNENIRTILGKAGTGFAEDTLCIHKGEPPVGRDRLLLQIQYAINDHRNQNDRVASDKLSAIPLSV